MCDVIDTSPLTTWMNLHHISLCTSSPATGIRKQSTRKTVYSEDGKANRQKETAVDGHRQQTKHQRGGLLGFTESLSRKEAISRQKLVMWRATQRNTTTDGAGSASGLLKPHGRNLFCVYEFDSSLIKLRKVYRYQRSVSRSEAAQVSGVNSVSFYNSQVCIQEQNGTETYQRV